jgi:hypothetical protein
MFFAPILIGTVYGMNLDDTGSMSRRWGISVACHSGAELLRNDLGSRRRPGAQSVPLRPIILGLEHAATAKPERCVRPG